MDESVQASVPSISLYAFQIRSFLESSDDVEVDEETLDELLGGLEESANTHSAVDAQVFTSEPKFGDRSRDGDNHDGVLDDDGYGHEEGLYVDLSPIEQYEEEAGNAWTKQDIREMKHHLKQHGMSSWVNEYVEQRRIPIPKLLYAFNIILCPELRNKSPKTLLYFLRVTLTGELRRRDKLTEHNTLQDARNLILGAQNILILTGAGISVSCGIPDFRSRDGLYATLKETAKYDLDDPQQMFDITYFRENPEVFYSFARQIYPSNFIPSPCHRFIKVIEDKGKLLRNYTQNIDTLETRAGVRRVLQCHGSFATASCVNCHRHVPGKEIEDDILQSRVPLCTVCNVKVALPKKKRKGGKRKSNNAWDGDTDDDKSEPEYPPGIMKPDITFFGEKLTDDFENALLEDREKVDLIIIIGTSLAVAPVADLLSFMPHSVPQILINKTPVRHINPDIVLLGNADDIVQHLCDGLGWDLPAPPAPLNVSETSLIAPNIRKRPSSDRLEPRRVANTHVWLFDGAEGGSWVSHLEQAAESASQSGSNDRNSVNALGSVRVTKKLRTN